VTAQIDVRLFFQILSQEGERSLPGKLRRRLVVAAAFVAIESVLRARIHVDLAIAAASCWYGGGIAGTKDERPNCPVQMHFGEKDASIPMTDVEAIRAAQPKVESYVYVGAQHGFGCDERASFSKPDYELAQKRTLEFFAKQLG